METIARSRYISVQCELYRFFVLYTHQIKVYILNGPLTVRLEGHKRVNEKELFKVTYKNPNNYSVNNEIQNDMFDILLRFYKLSCTSLSLQIFNHIIVIRKCINV